MLNSKQFTGKEVFIVIIYGIVFFSIPILSWYSNDYESAGNFANTFTPILSFVGSLLVYLALKSQIRANKIIQQQLEYDKFINQVESLSVRILNSKIRTQNREFSGYDIFNVILIDLANNQKSYAKSRVKKIIEQQFPKIANDDLENFIRFFRNDGVLEFDVDDKLAELKNAANSESFSNYLDSNFDFRDNHQLDNSTVNKNTTFENLIDGYFYLMDFRFKQTGYYLSYQKSYAKYGDFMESYHKRVFSILSSVSKMENSHEDSIQYLKNIFTTKEKIFMYQNLLASQTISLRETQILIKILDFTGDELFFNLEYFITLTNSARLKNELVPINDILETN